MSRRAPGTFLLATLLLAPPAGAATIQVGPDATIKTPSAAAAQAQDGDTIEIAAGEYFDCATWRANRLTITGPADPATPAVLSDTACQGKALFVVTGHDTTIRHLTFTRVRVPDGNGAGIRAEGRNLTVEASHFINNQVGILAADMPDGTLTINDSHFEANGACDGRAAGGGAAAGGAAGGARCMATVQTGLLLRLRIERSIFTAARGGELVRAAAQRTDILHSRFTDGPRGAANHLVALAGGAMLVADNAFEKGPASASSAVAVLVRDLWGPEAGMLFQRNTLANNTGHPIVFLHNLSAGTPRLELNRVAPGDTALDESGYWTGRARGIARSTWDGARETAGQVKRLVRRLLPF